MRSTAFKVKIEDLVGGKYVRSPDGTEPSHLLTPWGQRISRARVLATVVEKYLSEDQTYATLRIDDGSETIRLKAWQQDVRTLADLNIGELIDVIGRVREYAGEIYLVPEMIARVEDPNWELVRELEILRARRQMLARGERPRPKFKPEVRRLEVEMPFVPESEPTVEAIEEAEEPLPEVPEDVKKKVLLAFDKLDKGEGVAPIDIAAELDMTRAEVEDALRVLISDGEIFEPKVDRFKRLG
ncbi:MAG: hypothetical protein QMC89_01000 [Candidatus Hodarchaeaceae archaeon]|nr:hypothetical protein [Candidatus Hodarchaeaceae archaeon]